MTKKVGRLKIGDAVNLRGIGPGTVVEFRPLRVKLDSTLPGAYRAGAGRGSTVRVGNLNRVTKLERDK